MTPLDGPIAYLTGEYPRATDTFIQREVAALRQLGFTIETCSIRKTGPEHIVGPEQQTEQAGTFHVLNAVTSLNGLKAHGRFLKTPGRYLKALALAWRTAPKGIKGRVYNLIYFAEAISLAAHMQDKGIVHLHNHIAKASCTVAMLASAVSGIPYSFTLHGPDIFFAPDHWRLDEKIKRADFVACISNFCRSQAMLYSDQSHWDKLHIVHCGIDLTRYRGRRPLRGRDLLFVGRLAAVKGVPVLLKAFATVAAQRPSMTLTLIGDGPERREIEAQVAQMNQTKAINFAGYRSQDDVAQALATSDALILPSFAEGVPVSLMEAMASSLPVVATQVGGVAELVKDGVNGRLVPAGDEAALAQGILDVLDDGDDMGAEGRKTVTSEFDINKEAAWLGILLCATRAGGPRPGVRP